MSEAAAIELSESKDNRAEEQSTAEEQNLLETDDNIPVDHDQKVSSCLQGKSAIPNIADTCMISKSTKLKKFCHVQPFFKHLWAPPYLGISAISYCY